VSWLTWPVFFAANLAAAAYAIHSHRDLGAILGLLTIVSSIALVLVEIAFPYDPRWRMTVRSYFGRDIKYFVGGGAVEALISYGLALIGLELGEGHIGPIATVPFWLSVPLTIIMFDLCTYWPHRWCHETTNGFKRFLWRVHAGHHLPEQVYVLMNAAGHPVNTLLFCRAVQIPAFYYLGAPIEALFLAHVVIMVQGVFAHCNVDIRTGWVNYIFSGTEVHRYHHSAALSEAKNFAVTLSCLDVLFGTFVYRPGSPPDRLGVVDAYLYPPSNKFWQVMMIPFTTRPYGKSASAPPDGAGLSLSEGARSATDADLGG
jgi:sterol desaturase/sphingolipid hydroxylase (fatty acid hydroxylase superfamily)